MLFEELFYEEGQKPLLNNTQSIYLNIQHTLRNGVLLGLAVGH